MLFVILVLDLFRCASYEQSVSWLDRDYQTLSDPRYSSTFQQLSILTSLQYSCGQLTTYKEHNAAAPPQVCMDVQRQLKQIVKLYGSPNCDGIILLPDQKISNRFGCGFTYSVWNLRGHGLHGNMRYTVQIKLRNGQILETSELWSVYPQFMYRGFSGTYQTAIYNDIDPSQVVGVKFIITNASFQKIQ